MNYSTHSVRTIRQIFATIAVLALVFSPFANVPFAQAAQPAADIDQCRNGALATPVNCTGVAWVNGNAGEANSHYVEGQSVPYRSILTNLTPGNPVTITFGYDIKHSSHHAIDYLTSYDRIPENVDPINGVAGVAGLPSTFPIPAPSSTGSPVAGQPTASFNALPAGEREMSIWNGTISAISYASQGNLASASAESKISITFTPSAGTVVLAWGGHIGSRLDWGFDGPTPRSAGGISGSPYHMRLDGWTLGNLGNMDRSLSAGAVIAPGNLTVIKNVVGGSASASEFQINVSASTSATPNSFSGSESGTAVTIPVTNGSATYSVTEVPVQNYIPSYSTDCSGTINTAENKVCTITNTYDAPASTLTLVKNVDNQAGGSATAADWTLSADGATDISGKTGEASVTSAVVTPGTYTLSESAGPARYQAGVWSCTGKTVINSQVELLDGDNVTCTITNTYVPAEKASITVFKTVVNDNGGTADTSTFKYFVNTVTEVFHNVAKMFDAETPTLFTLTESSVAGYAAGLWGGSCATDGTVTLSEGQSATCTITNDDISPKLTINKVVINDDQTGSAVVADFKLYAGATEFVSGVQQDINAGTYTLSETGPTGSYGASYSCVVNNGQETTSDQVTLALGDTAVCTITNDDNEPTEATITINKQVVNGFGGDAVASDFSFLVNGSATTSFEGDTENGSKQIVVTQAGDYTITEPDRVDYVEDYSQCAFTGVELGSSYSCTVINTQLPACSDGLNNDGREDDLIDYPNDPGCDDGDDNDETDPLNSITIKKVVTGEGASDTQAFDFNITRSGDQAFNFDFPLAGTSTANTKEYIDIPKGTYTITEKSPIPLRWSLESISCVDGTGAEEIPTASGTNFVEVSLSVDEDITCTFTNEYTPRDSDTNEENIIIRKEVTDGSDVNAIFDFALEGETTDVSFQLSDGLSYDSGNILANSSYTITESNLPSGWSLDNVSCTVDDQLIDIAQDEFETDIEVYLGEDQTIICTFTNEQEIFELEGYVWNDADRDGIFDEDEDPLANWDVQATDGSLDFATTSAENGYYHFFVPAGTWTISETVQSGWDQTFPVEADDFVHVVTVPQYYEEEENFFEELFSLVVPTVYAQVPYPSTYGDFNFGNALRPDYSQGSYGGGGGSRYREPNDDEDEPRPEPQVLGEATSTMPVGAPNTGNGGASSVVVDFSQLVAVAVARKSLTAVTK